MELELYRTLWGIPDPFDGALARIKAEGFAGVEDLLPEPAKEAGYKEALEEAGFSFIPIILTEGATVSEHSDSLSRQVERAARFNPPKIGCLGGLDSWELEEAEQFLSHALEIEAVTGIPIAHETHRGRTLFNPWRTRDLLMRLPELRVCCDYSHWVVVAERLLDDEAEIRALCAERCIHVHARVGYEEGPQVPDPRAPEYGPHLAAHERWWDEIWDTQERLGVEVSTLTPEYGVDRYLHTLPYTDSPVADLWSICVWQAERERERFASRRAQLGNDRTPKS